MAKILVLGATGNIGSAVVESLLKRNIPFKAAVHTTSKAGKLTGAKGVEVVEVDLHKLETLTKALVGVEKLFALTPPGQTYLYHSILDEAKKAGVKHIVQLSGLGAEVEDSTIFEFGYEDQVNEEATLKAGIALTSLRPSSFYSNLFQHIPTIKGQSSIFSNISTAKMNWISPHDIGEVAAIALTEPGHEGKLYSLTGPENFTFSQVAEILTNELGRAIHFVPISDDDIRKKVSTFLPPQVIEPYMNMTTYFKNGGYDLHFEDLHRVTGSKGQYLKDYIKENIAAFQ